MITTINENICSSYKEESIQEEPNILHECVCRKNKSDCPFSEHRRFPKEPPFKGSCVSFSSAFFCYPFFSFLP